MPHESACPCGDCQWDERKGEESQPYIAGQEVRVTGGHKAEKGVTGYIAWIGDQKDGPGTVRLGLKIKKDLPLVFLPAVFVERVPV